MSATFIFKKYVYFYAITLSKRENLKSYFSDTLFGMYSNYPGNQILNYFRQIINILVTENYKGNSLKCRNTAQHNSYYHELHHPYDTFYTFLYKI